MIRGTTPTLRFSLPFDGSLLSKLYITAAQNDKVVFEKALSDCVLSGAQVTCKLTQADTLALDDSEPTEIQVRCKTVNGDAPASHIFVCNTERILKDGEI